MKLYLAPKSSLDLLRYLRSTEGDLGVDGTPMRKKVLGDAINTQRQIIELDETAQRWLGHIESPIHAYVADRSKGTSTKNLVTHVMAQPAPNGAFLDLGHHVAICSPQFAFMQMAAELDPVDAIALGMELCGSYSRWRLEPNEMGDPYYLERPETQACTFKLSPVMKSSRALAFVERHAGWRGTKGARAALKWVADNSASPMETATYLLLCLPKRLGGYGLPKATLNVRLTVRNPNGTTNRYPDLFWAGANIDVEYNSDTAHSGEWSRYRDSKREVELVVANVKVLPLTRQQLTSASEFDAFAQGLRRMLGIKARATDQTWIQRRDDLRCKLLSSWQ